MDTARGSGYLVGFCSSGCNRHGVAVGVEGHRDNTGCCFHRMFSAYRAVLAQMENGRGQGAILSEFIGAARMKTALELIAGIALIVAPIIAIGIIHDFDANREVARLAWAGSFAVQLTSWLYLRWQEAERRAKMWEGFYMEEIGRCNHD